MYRDMRERAVHYLLTRFEIPATKIGELEPYMRFREIAKDTILLRPGDVCQQGYLVTKGCLRSFVTDAKGKEHVIQFAPEDWIISDQQSIMNGAPAIIYIDAVEDTVALVLDHPLTDKIGELSPGRSFFHSGLLVNNLRAVQKRLVQLLSATAEERYLDFLRTYPDMSLRLPLHMIASYIGVAPSSLSRIRAQLVNKN